MARGKQNESLLKKVFTSKIFLLSMVGVLVFLGVQVGKESYRKYQLQQEINSLKSEISKIEGENRKLDKLMEYFKKDSYLEQEARVKLNLKKPGEKMVVFPETESSAATKDGSKEADKTKTGSAEKVDVNYWRWWEYFFE